VSNSLYAPGSWGHWRTHIRWHTHRHAPDASHASTCKRPVQGTRTARPAVKKIARIYRKYRFFPIIPVYHRYNNKIYRYKMSVPVQARLTDDAFQRSLCAKCSAELAVLLHVLQLVTAGTVIDFSLDPVPATVASPLLH
jgi:hypothetical protein